MQQTKLLIIGAGPFGLAMAAYAQHLGIDHLIVGKPMGLWQDNMPQGMNLRTTYDWHFDPLNVHTIEAYLQTQGLTPADADPIPRELYLAYARWYQDEKQIAVQPTFVESLEQVNDGDGRFAARLADGDVIHADNVMVALGYDYFKNIPDDLAAILPAGRYAHTRDFVDFDALHGKRCLIVGGRQSAFESAALIHEAGAAAVHVAHRHDTPTFTESDWSWLHETVDAMTADPAWYRNLSAEEKAALTQRFVIEGRLKLEPWLWPRLDKESVHLWPNAAVASCAETSDGSMSVTLSNGETLTVDQILLATGYKVDLTNVPPLINGNLLPLIETQNGFPVLDPHFQCSVPGLFFTSLPSALGFGLFVAFTVSANPSAKSIGQALVAAEKASR